PAQAVALGVVRHYRVSESGVVARARAEVEHQLESQPGEHLVIVRYSQTHDPGLGDWVYNHADIDHAKVVWAREITDRDMQPLFDYFRDREIWLAERGAQTAEISPQGAPREREGQATSHKQQDTTQAKTRSHHRGTETRRRQNSFSRESAPATAGRLKTRMTEAAIGN